jgi:hypothetical protein
VAGISHHPDLQWLRHRVGEEIEKAAGLVLASNLATTIASWRERHATT